jgi:hypothetical protein
MGLTNFPNGVTSFGLGVYGSGLQDNSGRTWFVDGNSGSDSNDGFTWATARQTLASAFTSSHNDIAGTGDQGVNRHWARRNTVFIAGDFFVEDLIAFPQKTDVIGVGSADGRKGAGITGNHVPVNTGTGTRWFNVNFQAATAADLITLTSACTAQEFHGCSFLSGGTAPTGGIKATASTFLKIVDCVFEGSFSNEYIEIAAGAMDGLLIKDCIMTGGADNGIMFTGTGTITANRRGNIIGNFIECADICIDVNSTSVTNVINNYMISGSSFGGSSHVIDLTWACNNRLTANDAFAYIPPEPA